MAADGQSAGKARGRWSWICNGLEPDCLNLIYPIAVHLLLGCRADRNELREEIVQLSDAGAEGL